MDTQKAFLAIALSFIILLGYQYLFIKPIPEQPQQPAVQEKTPESSPAVPKPPAPQSSQAVVQPTPPTPQLAAPTPVRQGRDILIDSDLFTAVLTETGGGFKSFKLKNYQETTKPDSGLMDLVKTEFFSELPLYFSWGLGKEYDEVPVYNADRQSLTVIGENQHETLTMKASLSSGIAINRTMTIDSENYLIKMTIDVINSTSQPLQGAPHVNLTNMPFAVNSAMRYLFSGPAMLLNNQLKEVKPDDIKDGTNTFQGKITWAAYEGTYFMTGIIPDDKENVKVNLAVDGEKVFTVLSGEPEIIPAQGSKQYSYSVYFGPKKLSILEQTGVELERIVNFGWFDVIAKPTLLLLNFINKYFHNYGIAIILVTVVIKILFWPIAQKGMKSMKNMQKIQPKIAKVREKYKNDSSRMNQEMMNLYKTYKINPLGGCLPMVLQIPVFFALYKVLLQAIELRHAPFMLWITDLSAPDRLWMGLDIPYLGGIPVLTLLMGGSMYLQQKMTPTPADPTQAKIMLFLPVIFTFMFLNFASGLVLYWFVNNLLSIGQQYMINRPREA